MKQAIRWVASCVVLGCTLGVSAAIADATPPDQVVLKDVEVSASLTKAPGNVADGKKWFANRKLGNCLACHANKDLTSKPFHGEIGPPIDGAGSRYSEAQLRAILVNSKAVFGDETIMPGFYRVNAGARMAKKFKDKTILSGQQIEDIIAYVMTLRE